MSNDIDGVTQSSLPRVSDTATNRRVTPEKQDNTGGTAPQARQDDTVALTDGARLLERVASQVAEASAVDTARVEQVRTELANGSYTIDDQKIADGILRSDRERG